MSQEVSSPCTHDNNGVAPATGMQSKGSQIKLGRGTGVGAHGHRVHSVSNLTQDAHELGTVTSASMAMLLDLMISQELQRLHQLLVCRVRRESASACYMNGCRSWPACAAHSPCCALAASCRHPENRPRCHSLLRASYRTLRSGLQDCHVAKDFRGCLYVELGSSVYTQPHDCEQRLIRMVWLSPRPCQSLRPAASCM